LAHPAEAVANQLGAESREPPEVGSADPGATASPKPSDLTFPDKPPSVPTKGKFFSLFACFFLGVCLLFLE